jgi:signal transduction histidine kinase
VSGALSTDLRRTAWRIGLQTAGLLIACLLVVSTVVYVAVVRSQEDHLSQTLADAVAAAAPGDQDRDRDGDDRRFRLRLQGGTFTAVLHDGEVTTSEQLPPGLPDVAVMEQVRSSGVEDRRRVDLSTGPYELLTVPRGDDVVVQAMASLLEQHQERERIIGALAVAGGAGLVLATLAAVVLARRAVTPMSQALESQRRFVADAGHELRTPLTQLSTRAQLLARRIRSGAGEPPARGAGPGARDRDQLITRDVEGIVADTSALTAILEELLLAADTRTPVPQEPVDVAQLVATAVASAQATAAEAGIALTLEPVTDDTVLPAGAPTALGRSVTALVDNALGHARSEVVVSVARRGRVVAVEVSDDGPGISEDVLPRMFTRFAGDRTETTTPGARRHYGLGLALVSEIAARHGGIVTAANRPAPDTGAVLRLELPLRA